jgi:hypothetical protein
MELSIYYRTEVYNDQMAFGIGYVDIVYLIYLFSKPSDDLSHLLE